ncbi:hypothetical protein D3C85_1785200 [compost metagenome]
MAQDTQRAQAVVPGLLQFLQGGVSTAIVHNDDFIRLIGQCDTDFFEQRCEIARLVLCRNQHGYKYVLAHRGPYYPGFL